MIVICLAVGVAHRGSPVSASKVLIPADSYYKLPADQFSAVAFIATEQSTLSGTFTSTAGINVYTMTPAEVVSLARTGLVSDYSWTSGHLANLTVTNLSVSVPAGSWNLVFLNTDNPTLNPIWTNVTIVGFYTDITIAPG